MRHNLWPAGIVHPLDLTVGLAEDDIEGDTEHHDNGEDDEVQGKYEDDDQLEEKESTEEQQTLLEVHRQHQIHCGPIKSKVTFIFRVASYWTCHVIGWIKNLT